MYAVTGRTHAAVMYYIILLLFNTISALTFAPVHGKLCVTSSRKKVYSIPRKSSKLSVWYQKNVL